MLLVLFVMFISSFLGLLVTQYVSDMITISWLFTNYYNTYFQAYGWLELWLSQINYRVRNDIDEKAPFWYEDTVDFSWYTDCDDCSFAMEIVSRSNVLTDSINTYAWCTEVMDNAPTPGVWVESDTYRIESWDWFIIPLFYDATTWFAITEYEVLSSTWFELLSPELYNDVAQWATTGTFLIRIIDDDNSNLLTNEEYDIWFPTPNDLDGDADGDIDILPYNSSESPENKNYLVIANPSGSVKDFCLEITWWELPRNWLTIQSVATQNWSTISFGAIKTNEIPSYLIYTTISWS